MTISDFGPPSPPQPRPTTITLPAPILAAYHRGDGSPDDDSGIVPAEWCATDEGVGCGREIDEGDPVRSLDGRWLHETCAVKAITEADATDAWLTLADLIVARPSAFKASDIRAVLSNVARIARTGGAR